MRYELADDEWTAIRPMLPNKLRGRGGRSAGQRRWKLPATCSRRRTQQVYTNIAAARALINSLILILCAA
jgi:hypothetical protein